MTRNRWREIRAEIEQDIMDTVLEPGARLPTEPELAAIYQAGRHSVRRAVTELAKQGFVSVEQGRGTFVQSRPLLEYTIGSRTRLRENMKAQGVDVSGEALGVEYVPASPRIARNLELDVGAEVIATKRLTLADGIPVSFGTLYHDASRFAGYPERRQALGSVSATYASFGIHDYLRASTKLHSRPARASEAQTLRQHQDMPVIIVRAVDATLDGRPIAFSQVVWSAARVKFSVPNSKD